MTSNTSTTSPTSCIERAILGTLHAYGEVNAGGVGNLLRVLGIDSGTGGSDPEQACQVLLKRGFIACVEGEPPVKRYSVTADGRKELSRQPQPA